MSSPPTRTAPSRLAPARTGLGRSGRDPEAPTYRLLRTAPPVAAPLVPDEAQREVLDHCTRTGGPLLVLAGPGTGKTTTLVEAVARRIEGGLSPGQGVGLTFSRKAAQELRGRVKAPPGEAA